MSIEIGCAQNIQNPHKAINVRALFNNHFYVNR